MNDIQGATEKGKSVQERIVMCKPSASELYPIVVWVKDRFKAKEYGIIDNWLKEIDLGKSKAELCTIIRTTYPARYKLDYWREALLRVESELENRGLNSAQMLRGLYT